MSLNETLHAVAEETAMLPEPDEALARLEHVDPEQVRIIELRYFRGSERRGIGRRARDGAGDAQAAMGNGPRVAVPRARRRELITPMPAPIWCQVRDMFERALEQALRISTAGWLPPPVARP